MYYAFFKNIVKKYAEFKRIDFIALVYLHLIPQQDEWTLQSIYQMRLSDIVQQRTGL